ncbi:TIGR03915 family putative DNA repair protein [Alloalcanivorax marinus]|uniref:TIGR03915 family putative DNA repair protein n=1 Tax=Alloalcanivorax marinus TaxID=1177169 RepID=UPI00195A4CAB|nr:TIGR03915 family putative DNA repair protein [Alloalcanivorax marinus]
MRILSDALTFDAWRDQARALLRQGAAPETVSWEAPDRPSLFGLSPPPDAGEGPAPRVPAALVAALRQAAPYRVAGRWNLLYRVLWRGAHGERQAHLPGDRDGSALQRRIKAVRREAHHLHAFLRFQPVADDDPQRPLDLLAWFEPAHDILPWASEHFADRLGRRRWLIATPLDGVWYDGEHSHYHAPCPESWRALAREARRQDDPLWRTYYRSLFNPARLNPTAMQGHMPARFRAHTPEGRDIPGLVADARRGARRHGQAAAVGALPGKALRAPKSPDAPPPPGALK